MKHGTRFKQRLLVCTFISITSFFVVSGLVVAKSGGLPARFQFLNPFAVEVDIAHKPSFHINFQRGYVVSERPHSRVLFVGDSVLQQFALPMTKALRISPEEADFVTRGGCVLLKGVDFIDKFSDISCNSLRDRLYNLDKRYDLVVISQQWDGYENSITNSPDTLSLTERWRGFLADTIIHFKHISDKVIIIGGHIKVAGTTGIQPSIRISRESLDKRLSRLRVDDLENTKKLDTFFSKLSKEYSIQAVKPLDIFCDNENCKLTDGKWSYFSDSQHISSASTEFVSAKLKKILASFE